LFKARVSSLGGGYHPGCPWRGEKNSEVAQLFEPGFEPVFGFCAGVRNLGRAGAQEWENWSKGTGEPERMHGRPGMGAGVRRESGCGARPNGP